MRSNLLPPSASGEPAYDAYEHCGLDFLQGYAWGLACVRGEPEGAVAAAFGGFQPGRIAGLHEAGRAACTPATSARRTSPPL